MKNIIISSMIILCVATTATAQNKVTINAGADLVSAYIWRGNYNAGASIQPSLGMNIEGFSLGAWGSTDWGGNGKKEVDLSVSYSFSGFKIGITDYWWAGEGAFKYFQYSKGKTEHLFEANLSYQLPFEKFPLTASWNTMFAGADYNSEGKNNYSTYVELNYPFSVSSVDMNAAVGFVPWGGSTVFIPVEKDGFSVCNVSLMATKAIKFSDKFSLPIFSQLIFNPALEDIHIVFGLSLRL